MILDPKILIRKMTPSDLDSVIGIEERSFPHPWAYDHFMAELARGTVSRCHVAVKCGNDQDLQQHAHVPEPTVVGFIMAWLVADELHITNLAVVPEARRGGVAAKLLEHALREATESGAGWCQLEVRVSNSPARNLYNRYGFRSLGRRKRYYQNGEDAVVMGKDLKIGT